SFAQARLTLAAGHPYRESSNGAGRPNQTLMVPPLSHVTSCVTGLIPTMLRGGKLVFMPRWDPELAMQLIEREKVTATGGVPTVVQQLLAHPAREKYDLTSLRFFQYGGAPSGARLVDHIRAGSPRSIAIQAYGLTETCSIFCSQAGDEVVEDPECCGRATPVGQIKIVDPISLAERACGDVGEVWLKGAQVVRGYWNRPQETATA